MCSVCRIVAFTAIMVPLLAAADLRVCADPNNLPFSNSRQQGFENDLARMAAAGLGRTVRFVWVPQRGRYLKKSLGAGTCDVMMGITAGVDGVRSTRPYYRSGYVFVYRRDRKFAVHSFDDPKLRHARIGVHIGQHEDAYTPAVRALTQRGLFGNIRWYKIYPDFSRPNPVFALLEALEKDEIDVAIAWGPTAGYYARHASVPMGMAPAVSSGPVPMSFDVAMGVAPGDAALATELNTWIAHSRPGIDALLNKYGIPRVPAAHRNDR